jgi:DNA-binding NtrC family response regulator
VRIIAATAYDIEQAVSTGRLREEFYYYLNVIPLHIPPLREHCEDVPELLEFYINFFVNQENLSYRRFTVAVQNRLRNYSWPGNIRELKNLVQRLLILGNDHTIEIDEVEPILKHRPPATGSLSVYDLPLREAREQFEKAYLEHQLQEVGGNVSKVASRVGLERTHLYRKLRALDIDPKQIKK